MIREKQEKNGPIIIDLTGPDGNAFALMDYAKRFATQLGWKDRGASMLKSLATWKGRVSRRKSISAGIGSQRKSRFATR